ncbi:MAG: STAS domain-containing protein [Marmoricola sp.]
MVPLSADLAASQPSGSAAQRITTRHLLIDRFTEADGELFAVTGELDLASGPEMRKAVMQANTAVGRNVGLDLSGLSFMDASGLRALLELRSDLARSGGRLVLRAAPRRVRRVLDLTDLGPLLLESP